MKKKFNNKILIIGYGSVSQCTLPVLLDKIDVPLQNITIIDFEDKSKALKKYTDQGLKYVCEKITPQNIDQVLSKYLDNGSLLIDLAWNIGANDIIKWCHDHEVLYVNTSVEVWDPTEGVYTKSPFEKSLYWRQMQLLNLSRDWKDAPTAVIDHGANPGLISHFVKEALLDIAARIIFDKKASVQDEEEIAQLAKDRNFPRLAKKLGIKVIHCSERDTQIANRPKEVNEFVGTWSIEGLREEGTAPAEIGWGTHEKKLPPLANIPPCGPKNQIFLPQMGINTWVRSWIPDQEIIGMMIRHGEAFGLSDRLTVCEDGLAVYRPTVNYAYMPCHDTLSSLWELRGRNYELQPKIRIMTNEIISGEDTLGALLMGHPYNSWWTGSSLSIDEARSLAPGQNATTLQVAAGIVAAVLWMLENPREGIKLPDDLPHDFILGIAKPYLGKFISTPSDWTPLKNRKIFFKEHPSAKYNPDPWQIENFLFIG
ncbi:homospermidine synthase [Methanosarcinales archaeon]|nr:saccharopine dehydrogenase NADP-binding domain-containing protein [Candidatus Methanoperedens sp.]CAG0954368.1 homospermidine synthase [Methanosarcinales archaeon]